MITKEKFIEINVNMKKGQRAYYSVPTDKTPTTPLSRLMTMAYLYAKKLHAKPNLSLKEFCIQHKISPRYLRGILQFNFMSPNLKKKIMSGWMPSKISTQKLLTGRLPLSWAEQEELII